MITFHLGLLLIHIDGFGVMPCGTSLGCGCYLCDVIGYLVLMAFSFSGILFYINKLLNCVCVITFCWGCVVNSETYITIGS